MFINCLRSYVNIILLYYLNFTGQKYPLWFLKKIDGDTINFSLSRKSNIQKLYNNRSKNIRNDFIDSLFDPYIVSNDVLYKFLPNNFPYNIEDGLLHYVLWIRPGVETSNTTIRSIIAEKIVRRFKKPYEFTFFKNSDRYKSIPDVEHYHVFIKRYDKKNFFVIPGR